ncbi:MAG: hypothetical protein RR739_06685, partial [Clostridia bacterium]
MTKKWLSLVLVLTLLASLFSGAAMAAAGDVALVFTKDASLSEIKLEAGRAYNMPIGTITAAGETITTAQWQAIRDNKFAVEALAVTNAINTYVSQAGVLSVAFTAAANATTKPVSATLTLKQEVTGYKLAESATGLTFSIEVPVASIATKTYNGTAYASVKSMTIDTNPSNDTDAYKLYV